MNDPSYPTKPPTDKADAATPPGLGEIGGYRVVKQLGQGGMGVVFQAEDPQLRRTVALKVMRGDIAESEQSRARFLREARAAAALKHDHIVTIYQVSEDKGVPFLAMEFLQGKSLEEWLRPDRRATVAETLTIGKQIAKGLAAAHAIGLIHRDIKPANIWLEAPRGRVKILDFGLARHMDGELTALTQDGAVLGTPAFMAPEQGRGESVDPRCDLFSLGCVLYRMVTGRLPFQGNTMFAVLSAIASETPTLVRTLNPNVPPQLADLITRLLSKKPEQRPASAQAVWDELSAVEKETKQTSATPTIAAEAPLGERTTLPRWLWPALGGGILLAALAVFIVAWKPPPEKEAEQEAGNAPPTAAVTSGKSKETADKETAGSVDLLKLIDLDEDSYRGQWSLRNGRLVGQPAKKEVIYSVIVPWDPPSAYRFKFTATRLSKDGNAGIGLASGTARFIVVIDGTYKKYSVSGLALLDGKPLVERADARKGRMLPIGRPVAITCVVKPNEVRVEAEDKVVVNFNGNVHRATRATGQSPAPLLLGGAEGSFAFSDVVLEPLDAGVGQPLERKK